jgi:hypothetical protein
MEMPVAMAQVKVAMIWIDKVILIKIDLEQ